MKGKLITCVVDMQPELAQLPAQYESSPGADIPLRVIQEISGHNDLGTLQRYLEVSPEQKRNAVGAIGF